MEESVGMIVAMNEITQDSRKTGTALKTISANMAGVTTSAKDGTLQTNKTAKALREIAGIDVWDKQTGQIKDMYQVMDELNGKWGDLSEAQRNALATSIAGKTQLNTFNALMQNWGKAKQLVSEYKQGLTIGSAEKENLQYLDSIQGKWNAIKENLKSIGTSLISSDMVKGALDAIQSITDKMAQFASTDFGKNAIGFTAIATAIGVVTKALSTLSGASSIVKTLGSIGSTASGISGVSSAIAGIGTASASAIGGATGLAGALMGIATSGAAIPMVAASLVGLAAAVGDSTTALSALQDAFGELSVIGEVIGNICETINGTLQATFGGLWESAKGIGKLIKAIFTGDFASIDDIIRETAANMRTNMNEAMSDMNADTTNALKIMKNSTQSEMSGIKEIFNNDFKDLTNLTSENLDDTARTWTNKMQSMTDEQIEVCKGMGGEIGATLFKGIYDGMDYSKMQDQFKKNMKNLLDSGIIEEKDVSKLIDTFNTQFEKCAKDSATNFKQAGTDLFNQLKEGLTSGDWEDAFSDATQGMDNWTNEMLQKQASFNDEWGALLDGVTEDMDWSDKYSTMLENAQEYMKAHNMGWEEFIQGLREGQIEAHEILNETTEDVTEGMQEVASKSKEELAKSFEELDMETKIELKTEFAGVDEAQLYTINSILEQFPEEIQTKLKAEGFKEVLADSQNVEDFLTKLPEEKLIEIMSNTQFVGSLTPEQLQVAVERLPDEKVVEILSNTQFVGSLTPEQLSVFLNTLPPETRADVISNLIQQGALTPEQLAASLQSLPPTTIAEIILQCKEEGKSPEEINALLLSLPPEVRTVVEAIINEYGSLENYKRHIDDIPTEKNTNLNVNETNPGTPRKVKEDVEGLPTEKDTRINVTETNPGVTGKIKEELEGTPEEKKINVDAEVGEVDTSKINNADGGTVEVKGKVGEVDTSSISNTSVDPVEVEAKVGEVDTSSVGNTSVEPIEIEAKVGEVDTSSVGNTSVEPIEIKAKVGEVDTSSISSVSVKPIEIEAKVGKVDTSSISSVSVKPIEIEAKVGKVDLSFISSITAPPIDIKVNTSSAMSSVNSLKSAISSIKSQPINITANAGSAVATVNSLKSTINSLQSKSITISVSANAGGVNALKSAIAGLKSRAVNVTASTSGTAQVNALTSAIARVKSKAVSVKANVTGTGAVNALTSAINRVKSKSVKISASVSGTGAVQGLASAIAGVHSKSVSVSVTKTVTTVQQSAVASSTPISATPMLMNTPLADIPVSASDESSIDVPVSISANNAFGGTLDKNKILPSLDFDISHIKNLEEALKRLGKQIDFLNEKSEAVFGQEKINLLQQQIPLLREQQKIQEQIAKNERAQNNELVYWLSQQGFAFDNLGNISNYNDKLLAMEQNVESLKKKYDDLNDAKDKNETATKNAQKAYESANETLSKTKDYLEEYFTTNNQEITEASEKWWEYENAIREAEEAVRDLANAQLEFKIDSISNEIDFLDSKIKAMDGQDKIGYIKQQNDLYKQQQSLLHVLAEQMREQLTVLDPLSDEYAELSSKIMDLSTEWWDLQNAIADNKMDILEEQTRGMKDKIDLLSDQIDFLDSKMDNYSGTEKTNLIKQQTELYKQQQDALHVLAEELRRQLTLFDEGSEEYVKIQREITSLSTEWWDLEKSINSANEELRKIKKENILEPLQNSLQEIEYLLDRCNDRIDLLDETNKRSQGKTKIDYLNNKIGLLNERLGIAKEEFNKMYNLAAGMQSLLWQHGFSIDENGLISNYDEVLNGLVGTDVYEEAKDAADEYMKLMRDGYIENKLNILETQNEIKELADEIEKLTREAKLFVEELDLTILNQQFDKLSNRLEIIDNELEYAYGADKLNLMNESIELMNQQLVTQGDIISKVRQQMKIYQKDLGKYGFSFDNEGNILNYKEMMEYYQNTEDIEKLKDLTEEYFDLQSNELPNLIGKYSDLEKEIKDAYKDQLEITQDIEEEITKIIEKEYERRKDEIEKYTDERIKLLEKEKKAYQDMRDEQDYEKSINEQTKEIADLQKKLETARKDNSIAGLKRQSEILKEIEEAQKKLEETTQDRIDKNYESNIDDEIDKLEEEQEKLLASLDEKFSETNIAKMVAQAISSGFIEINGEVKTLQDALIQSVNDSAEGYSVMADIIKNELVSNLNVALNTMQQIADINEKLGLQNFNVISATQVAPTNIPAYDSGNSKSVTIGDTIINVSGSVDDITLGKIEDMIKEENERMLKEITNGI